MVLLALRIVLTAGMGTFPERMTTLFHSEAAAKIQCGREKAKKALAAQSTSARHFRALADTTFEGYAAREADAGVDIGYVPLNSVINEMIEF